MNQIEKLIENLKPIHFLVPLLIIAFFIGLDWYFWLKELHKDSKKEQWWDSEAKIIEMDQLLSDDPNREEPIHPKYWIGFNK